MIAGTGQQGMDTGGPCARCDLLGGAGWIFFGLVVVIAALRMDRFEAMGASLYTMPGLVPGLFGGVLVLLGASLALRGWRQRRADPGTEGAPLVNARVATMLALSLVYAVALVGRAPFWLGTVLFVGAFSALFAPPGQSPLRRAAVAAAAGVLTTLAVVYVFEDVFLVRLP